MRSSCLQSGLSFSHEMAISKRKVAVGWGLHMHTVALLLVCSWMDGQDGIKLMDGNVHAMRVLFIIMRSLSMNDTKYMIGGQGLAISKTGRHKSSSTLHKSRMQIQLGCEIHLLLFKQLSYAAINIQSVLQARTER